MHGLCSNFAGRYSRRQQGYNSRRLDRQYAHSHLRKARTIRSQSFAFFTCCAFIPCTSSIAVGMVGGKVKLYNSKNGNECITHHCHENNVRYVKCSKNGTLLLTSSFHTRPVGKMWNIEQNQFSMMLHFAGDEYLEFSNLTEDKIVGTKAARATIYDTHTGQAITTFQSSLGNSCRRNIATFSPSDDLILSDRVLWDVRSGEQVYKFDMSNQIFSGVFYPNSLEIVSDDKVWDMRTLRLLRTVPELQGSIVKFSPQNVIYAIESKTRHISGINPILTVVFMSQSFRTLDGYNYSTIKIENVGRTIFDLSVNKNGSEIALVENEYAESALRIYSVGKRKDEDDEDDTDDRCRNNERHFTDERYSYNNDEN